VSLIDWPRRHPALTGIVVAALAVRLVLVGRMTVFHADEVWQYLEPAYGLVTGQWVRAWEFHAGIRGWFVPVMLSIPIAIGQAIAPHSQLHVYLVRGTLALISLGVVFAWYDLARPTGRRHALIAAWVAAIWCEVFYFGGRPSAEALGLSLLFPAMALAQRMRQRPHRGQAFALGLLVALGFVVRFHYLPAIGLICLWSLGRGWRRTLPPLAAGLVAGLILGGLGDVITGHPPLLWVWRSIAFNVVQGGSDLFGTQPPWWFITFQIKTWGWAALILIPLALVGMRRLPMVLAIAVAVYATHSLIPHKEYRFVLLATAALILLAAIGSVDLWDAVTRRLRRRPGERATLLVLALGWGVLSLAVALSPVFREYWQQGEVPFTTLVLAGEQPGLCGFAMVDQPAHPALALSLFNRPVPVLLFDGPEAPAEVRAAAGQFNVIEASQLNAPLLPPDYRRLACWGQDSYAIEDRLQCLYVRPGSCSGTVGDFAYQPAIERRGK